MRNPAETKDQYIVPNSISQLSYLGWPWFYYSYNSADLHSNLQRASMSNHTVLRGSAAKLKIGE